MTEPLTPEDAADVWDASVAPGGYVCGACEMPTESEPCSQHQQRAHAAAIGGDR